MANITTEQIKKYIQSLFKNITTESLTIGSRKRGSSTGVNSMTAGSNNEASGPHSAAIGTNNEATGNSSVALGEGTKAHANYQFVHGKWNESDDQNQHNYAHIVGGGEANDKRKNIYTLDWEGNATFAGSIRTEKVPTGDNDLVNLGYLNSSITTKFFPHTEIDENTIEIFVNDLEPHTAYKVRMKETYRTIYFTVRAKDKNGNTKNYRFFTSDETINKYNLYVGYKDANKMIFNINAIQYVVEFHELYEKVKITKTIDNSFAGPGLGEGGLLGGGNINDNDINSSETWSSLKINTEINKSVSNITIINGVMYLYNKDGELIEEPTTLADAVLPEFLRNITEKDVESWHQKVSFDDLNHALGNLGDGITADDVTYSTDYSTDIDNVKEALDKIYDKVFYVGVSINSFVASVKEGMYEMGSAITEPITFTWTTPSKITSQSITNIGDLAADVREATYNKYITSKTVFTLTVSDGKSSATKALTYDFGYNVYWGAASSGTYNSAFINSLSSKAITTNRKRDITVNAGSNQYIYYCIPANFGTPTFHSGGFEGGFELAGTISHTYASGYTTNYNIWKSDNSGLGNTTVNIS